jgi:hypothetical protein
MDWFLQVESDRMSWCLADVIEMHGNVGLSGGYGLWGPADAPTIYPDVDPTGASAGMMMPSSRELGPTNAPAPSGLRPATPPLPLDPPLPQPPAGQPTPAVPLPPTPSPFSSGSNTSPRRARMTAPSNQPPATSAAPAESANWNNSRLGQPRVERSDNATVYYSEVKPRFQPQPQPQPFVAPPSQREIEPAYYQTQPQPPGRDYYDVRPVAGYPMR